MITVMAPEVGPLTAFLWTSGDLMVRKLKWVSVCRAAIGCRLSNALTQTT